MVHLSRNEDTARDRDRPWPWSSATGLGVVFDECAVNIHNLHMKRGLAKSTGVRARRAGRKPKVRPATVRRKNLLLDQAKLDLLRGSLGVATDQEAVERVIDEAVIDRELIDATLALGGSIAGLVDVGRRR